MQVFKIQDGEIIINKPEFALYPSLNYILRRDRDRYKKQAFKELAYIYFTKDPESVVYKNGYNEEEAHKYAIEHSHLDDNWELDDNIVAAQKEYEHINSSVIKEVIRESLISFRNYAKVTKLIRKHIDKLLEVAEEDDKVLGVDEINKLIGYSQQLIELGSAIPQVKDKLYNSLRAVERTIDIDKDEDLVRGTMERVPMSYDPEKDFGNG